MTYLDRINHLWNLRRNGGLRSSDHEVCTFLLDSFNRFAWKQPVVQANALICGLLSISEKTLMDSRNRLKQDGLIEFKPGRKGSPTEYFLMEWVAYKPPNALSCERANEGEFVGANEGTNDGPLKSKEKEQEIPPNPQGTGEGVLPKAEVWKRCSAILRRPAKARSYEEEEALCRSAEITDAEMRLIERVHTVAANSPEKRITVRRKIVPLLRDLPGELTLAAQHGLSGTNGHVAKQIIALPHDWTAFAAHLAKSLPGREAEIQSWKNWDDVRRGLPNSFTAIRDDYKSWKDAKRK